MKRLLSILAALSLAASGAAFAHAHLEKSQPADKSSASAAPKEVVLEFNEPVQVTALTIQKGDETVQDLGPLPKAATAKVTVPMPAIGSGKYIVKWRAVSDDNHVMNGKFTFTVVAK
jgi:methionine-rich copper-binding protein CopC